MSLTRLIQAERCIGILPIFKPAGISLSQIQTKLNTTIKTSIYNNPKIPTRTVFTVDKNGDLGSENQKDYSAVLEQKQNHPDVSIKFARPEIKTIDQGLVLAMIGQEELIKFPDRAVSIMNKLPVYGKSNEYILHFILGMTSKNDDDIIDERSTWDHVTNEKIDEIVHLLNLHQKQHVMLSHDPFYKRKVKSKQEQTKLAYDENSEFMEEYRQKLIGLKKQNTPELMRFRNEMKKGRLSKDKKKFYESKSGVMESVPENERKHRRLSLHKTSNQVEKLILNYKKSDGQGGGKLEDSEDRFNKLPYFSLILKVQNESLKSYTKQVATNLSGKLNCVCKLQRIERKTQFCFSSTTENIMQIDDLDDIKKITSCVSESNRHFDNYINKSEGAFLMNMMSHRPNN